MFASQYSEEEDEWQLQEAKAKFSEVVKRSKKKRQIITKNGKPSAVLISIDEYYQLRQPEGTLLDFFRHSPYPNLNLDIERSKERMRDIDL